MSGVNTVLVTEVKNTVTVLGAGPTVVAPVGGSPALTLGANRIPFGASDGGGTVTTSANLTYSEAVLPTLTIGGDARIVAPNALGNFIAFGATSAGADTIWNNSGTYYASDTGPYNAIGTLSAHSFGFLAGGVAKGHFDHAAGAGLKIYAGTATDSQRALLITQTSTVTASTPGGFRTQSTALTVNAGSNSSCTYFGNFNQVTNISAADIIGGNHTVAVYGECVMNASGRTQALSMGLQGKLTQQAGTLTAGESIRAVLGGVNSGATLTLWTGVKSKITDSDGTLTAAQGFCFEVDAITGAAVTTMTAFRATDVSTSYATTYSGFKGEVAAGTNHFNLNLTGTAQNFLGGVTGIGIAAAAGGWATLGAGTTAVAPLVLTSGTNLTTAAAGVMEFDGKVFYATAAASSRQAVNAEQYSFLVNDFGLANSASAQAYLAAAQDTLTVQGATLYQFETLIAIQDMGGTTRTTGFLFGGTATFTNCQYWSILHADAGYVANTNQTTKLSTGATINILNATNASQATTIRIRGTFAINAGGTIIPQIQFSADPTGTILAKAGTYFRCWPVGSNAAVSVGNWA